jgi:hypothetical protein
MAEVVVGLDKLIAKMKQKIKEAKAWDDISVNVGYSAPHAAFVHEDLEALHGAAYNAAHEKDFAAGRDVPRRPQEQAKYLEDPSRRLRDDMATIVRDSLKSGDLIAKALYKAGAYLLEASKELVPTDTGELMDSGFVRVG